MKIGKLLFVTSLMVLGLAVIQASAQSKCCSKSKNKSAKTAVCTAASAGMAAAKTSGCTPSACRGAKTKFVEAKVITALRENLIALKAEMETSTEPTFESWSYNIQSIIGETDDESLNIIVKELIAVETVFAEKMEIESKPLELPENKAKQVLYLNERISALQSLL